MWRSDVRRLSCVAAMLACGLRAGALQDDASRLQQSGVTRLDAFIEHFRRTGEFRSRLPELGLAEAELMESADGFLQAGQLSKAAWSLIKVGDARRMQDRAEDARQAYDHALDVARRAAHPGYQAKASIGLAKVESMALRDYGAASEHVNDALRLAAPLEDPSFYLDALEQRSAIDIGRRDLVAAADAINRVLAMAEARQDRVRLLFGHFSRADVYQQMVRACAEARQAFSLCSEALGLAMADYERAQSLSMELGYEGLASEMAGFLRRLDQYRALIEQQENFTKSVARFARFEPTKPSDVLVTEQFATGSLSIPPGLTELIRQAGITSSDPLGVYTQAMFEEAQGNADAALRTYLDAVDLLERDRGKLKDESSRGSFLEDKVAIYDPPILHLLDRRRYADAFALLERSRARAMTDLFTTRARPAVALL